jgi:hypothetical protein
MIVLGNNIGQTSNTYKLNVCNEAQMEQCIFCIFIDYREQHRKGVPIYVAT